MVLDLRLIKIGCRETINFFMPMPHVRAAACKCGTKKASEGRLFEK